MQTDPQIASRFPGFEIPCCHERDQGHHGSGDRLALARCCGRNPREEGVHHTGTVAQHRIRAHSLVSEGTNHPGLPFIARPVQGELLGAWLLRIADSYGLGLATFLNRISGPPDAARSAPHWFALRDSDLHIQTVSRALRASPASLAAMSPLRCRVHWPQELGMCPRCLNEAAASGRPVTWPRHWMHPLATVCEIHRSWLTPVASASLARIRQARSFIELASLAGAGSDDARMDHAEVVETKYRALAGRLDEATLRLWAAAEARSLGRGGVSVVAKAAGGMSGLRKLKGLRGPMTNSGRESASA